MGLMQLKQSDFNPQSSYIVTAVEQKEYFQVILKAAELALPQLAGVTHNISTGTVKLSTGKMSSRQGNTINIGWLFDRLEKALRQRGASIGKLQEEMVGALRYSLLKNRLGSDVIFDVSESISLAGNSGPYLQYAYVRAHSILQKSAVSPADGINQFEPGERSLAYKISEYPEVVEQAFLELMPHLICNYLYELAQVFNRFYENNRVLGSDRQAERLLLVELYLKALSQGLSILGIPTLSQM
jgi:arginyl-tRNA synthetase